ncbi:hypothetical protein FJY68_01290 [candidate division WOR-3 bacterium]|uniref:Lipoprotein n=1 Tax=candidate division WOR-3 bacterium TaxID=2052148 RepID=A0A937XC29_UNCW3|nr:hypothetical protein [candidate division WOR-3 bacterium]
MRWTRVALTALAVAACARQFTAGGKMNFAPRWRVGDWWVVKTWEPARVDPAVDSGCSYKRYCVAGVETVEQQDCYVLRAEAQDRRNGTSRDDFVWYVRTDNWLVVRQVLFSGPRDNVAPETVVSASGLVGALFGGEQCLPRFPLKPEEVDTMFQPRKLEDYAAWQREISGVADAASVQRLLDEGDTVGGRVVRPRGIVYQVRTESGGEIGLRAQPAERRIVQSLQFWSRSRPWRVYGELLQHDADNPVWGVVERSWLVASGHKKK